MLSPLASPSDHQPNQTLVPPSGFGQAFCYDKKSNKHTLKNKKRFLVKIFYIYIDCILNNTTTYMLGLFFLYSAF